MEGPADFASSYGVRRADIEGRYLRAALGVVTRASTATAAAAACGWPPSTEVTVSEEPVSDIIAEIRDRIHQDSTNPASGPSS